MLALRPRALVALGISGLLSACTHSSSTSSITPGATLSAATAAQPKAEVEAILRKGLEHSCTFGSIELSPDIQIEKTSFPGKYQFTADYYERLSRKNVVTAYTAKGTCDTASKKVELVSLVPKYNNR